MKTIKIRLSDDVHKYALTVSRLVDVPIASMAFAGLMKELDRARKVIDAQMAEMQSANDGTTIPAEEEGQ